MMFKPDYDCIRRLHILWFLRCFGGNKDGQSSCGGHNVRGEQWEHASQREPIAPEEPSTEGKKTKMVQREGRISWKRAKRLLSVHRLTDGCVPRPRRGTSTLGFEEGDEQKLKQKLLPEREHVRLGASLKKGSRKGRVAYRREPRSEGRSEIDAARGQMVPVLRESRGRLVQASKPEVLPVPFEVSPCSVASSSEESKALAAGDQEATVHGSSCATIIGGGVYDADSVILHKVSMGTGISDELESLTPGDSTTSSVDGLSHQDAAPSSVISTATTGSVEEALSSCVAGMDEIESRLARDTAVVSNQDQGLTKDGETQTVKPPFMGLGTVSVEPLNRGHFEEVKTLSASIEETETSRKSPPLLSNNDSKLNKEGEMEVKQVLLDVTEKVPADLPSPSLAETKESRANDIRETERMVRDSEASLLKDPEHLSCPRIPQLQHKQNDCSLNCDGESISSASMIASSGMEASSGLLSLLHSESSKSRNVQYPPSIRAYRLQRRMERFQSYFEEFLETERIPRERADRKSQVVNRVRRLFEDGSPSVVV